MNSLSNDPTTILQAAAAGRDDAVRALAPLVYDELCAIARRYLQSERPDHTLQTGALVNEAFVRLFDQTRVQWNDRSHFIALAAKTMRHILVNHARDRVRQKRGGGARRVPLDEHIVSDHQNFDLIELEEVLQQLEALDPQQARLVELRFYAGLSIEETAAVLGCSTATVKRDWTVIRAWLLRALQQGTVE